MNMKIGWVVFGLVVSTLLFVVPLCYIGCNDNIGPGIDKPLEEKEKAHYNIDETDWLCKGTNCVFRWHDKQENTTCYIYSGYEKGGISCLRDKE